MRANIRHKHEGRTHRKIVAFENSRREVSINVFLGRCRVCEGAVYCMVYYIGALLYREMAGVPGGLIGFPRDYVLKSDKQKTMY